MTVIHDVIHGEHDAIHQARATSQPVACFGRLSPSPLRDRTMPAAAALPPWDPDYSWQPTAVVQIYSGRLVNFIELLNGPQGGIRFNSVYVGGWWQTTQDCTEIRWCFHRAGEANFVPVMEHYLLHPNYNVDGRRFETRRPYRMPRVYFNSDRTKGSMLIELQMRMPEPPVPPPPPPLVPNRVVIEEVPEGVQGFLDLCD